MKTIGFFGMISLTAGLCFGETWTGQLIDAECYQTRGKDAVCSPTAETTHYALQTKEGKAYKLDDAGNTKAAGIIKGNPKPDVHVKVEGMLSGDKLIVDSMANSVPVGSPPAR